MEEADQEIPRLAIEEGNVSVREDDVDDGQSSVSSSWSVVHDELCIFKNQSAIERFKCCICNSIARNPYQLTCPDKVSVVCGNCLTGFRTKGIRRRCIRCNSTQCKSFEDRILQNFMNELEVYCIHRDKEQGCLWEGTFADVEAHVNQECPYGSVVCENGCNVKVMRRDLDSHMADSCPLRRLRCELCGEEGTPDFIVSDEHVNNCGGVELVCENGCDSLMRRRDVEDHRMNCQLRIVKCPYRDFGCEMEMVQREMMDHIEEKAFVHLDMVVNRVKGIGRPIKLSEFTRCITQGERKWLSDGFYTSIGGYHMRLCVKPTINRDTNAQYLSVYINVLPGLNDDNLDWPLRGKVTVMLLNQLEDHNHKVHHIMINDRIPVEHTQRKVRSDEMFCGQEYFIKMTSLHLDGDRRIHYLNNNSLYFRVLAQLESETKPWLAMQ